MPTSNYMPNVVVEIAFNAGYSTPAASRVWTDVSDYVELDRGIGITYGRQDRQSTAGANMLTLTLDNRDGRFTAERSGSPYYPNVKLYRPIRVTATPPGGTPSVRSPSRCCGARAGDPLVEGRRFRPGNVHGPLFSTRGLGGTSRKRTAARRVFGPTRLQVQRGTVAGSHRIGCPLSKPRPTCVKPALTPDRLRPPSGLERQHRRAVELRPGP